VVKYVNDVYYLLKQQKINPILAERLRLELYVYPPDLKRRDLDNLCKAVLDALQHAGVYPDDFRICQLYVERCSVRSFGEIEFILKGI
jgi:crossover junction endodeoxyribonuclease RusA